MTLSSMTTAQAKLRISFASRTSTTPRSGCASSTARVHMRDGFRRKFASLDIRNFYVVCGQAQKSITAKHAGLTTLYQDLKRRNELWGREGYNRFLKGGIKDLSYFKEKSRRAKLEFEMVLVPEALLLRSQTTLSVSLPRPNSTC